MITYANVYYHIETGKWRSLVTYKGQKYGGIHDTRADAELLVGRTVVRFLCLN